MGEAVNATETKVEPITTGVKCSPNENNEFVFKVNLWEYQYEVEGCEGVAPTLDIKRGVEYTLVQKDVSNWFHPLGLAYYPDGAHDDSRSSRSRPQASATKSSSCATLARASSRRRFTASTATARRTRIGTTGRFPVWTSTSQSSRGRRTSGRRREGRTLTRSRSPFLRTPRPPSSTTFVTFTAGCPAPWSSRTPPPTPTSSSRLSPLITTALLHRSSTSLAALMTTSQPSMRILTLFAQI